MMRHRCGVVIYASQKVLNGFIVVDRHIDKSQ